MAKQVHGTRLVAATELSAVARRSGQAGGGVRQGVAEADGIVVRRPGLLAAVATADCVPVLLVAEARRAGAGGLWAACVHAGWRGTLAGIVVTAVDRARAEGVSPQRLRAALGPSIGPCCYDVGADLAARFREKKLPVLDSGGRSRLDLRDINRRLLESCGLLPRRIQLLGPCTCCHSDSYHSYRHEPANPGRQLSWIGWEAASP